MTEDAGSEGCTSPMSTGGRGIPLARASLGFDPDGASNSEHLAAAPLPLCWPTSHELAGWH